jgi:hypothetical protein
MRRPDARNILIDYKEDRKHRIKQMKEVCGSVVFIDAMMIFSFRNQTNGKIG